VKRHASVDELASLAVDELRPRKATRIRAHVTGCTFCTQRSEGLQGVTTLLASVQFQTMPEYLSVRMDAAIASEAVHRLASEPATEGGRGELPVRARSAGRPGRRGWGFRFSGPAVRVLAAAGAFVIVGAGGYEIATHLRAASSSSATSGAAAERPQAQPGPFSNGSQVSYQSHGHKKYISAITTDTDFLPGKLGHQAAAALANSHVKSAVPNGLGKHSAAFKPSSSASSASSAFPAAGAPSAIGGIPAPRLTACVDLIARGSDVLLLEIARFNGQPATIIVVAASSPQSADVWVVGTACGAQGGHVLDHVKLTHL